MIASTTNTMAATTTTAHNRDATVLRRRRSTRDADAAGSNAAELVFAALLSKTHVAAGVTARGEPKASAFQMFEPGTGDARARRQASLEAESRAGGPLRTAGGSADGRSVAARLAAKDAEPFTGQRGADSQTSMATSAEHTTETPRPVEPEIQRDPATPNRHRDAVRVPRHNAIQTEQADRRDASRLVDRAKPVSESAQAAGAVSSTATEGRVNAASNGPAHDVAHALRVGLSTDVELARAPAPAAGPPRSARHDQGQPAKTARNNQGGDTRQARSSGEASKTEHSAFERLVRSLRLKTGTHRSFARLHLEPRELGRVSVDLELVGDELRIDVQAETAEARKLLYEGVRRLRAALEQHGIQIERFEVARNLAAHGSDVPTAQQESGEGDRAASGEVGGEGSGRRAPSEPSGKPIAGRLARPGDGTRVEMEIRRELTTVGERRLDVRV